MALMNVELKDLTSVIHRTGRHAVDAGNHADIWLGEYVDPKQGNRKACTLTERSFTRSDILFQIKVAIKVIRSAFTAEDSKRFNEVSGSITYRPLDLVVSRN